MCDLFCGRGGWTKGFQAHGWRCIGFDLHPQPDYPGEFIQADIAHLHELPEADFYCCSSPCEQFSVHGMKHFHPNPKWPWLGIALFEYARRLMEATGKPYVMENVRAAEKFMGYSQHKCGSFHLWGAVPPIVPQGVTKGMTQYQAYDPISGKRILLGMRRFSSKSKQRAIETAKIAEIPQELSSHIAQFAERITE